MTSLPQAIRIWLDDPNPIFRMGLAASLRDPRFVVVGESAGFVPPPPLDDVDVLVFDLGEQSADCVPGLAARARRHRRSTRLVGLVPGGEPEAAQHSQCTVLIRSELTPEGFRNLLASVVAGASAPAGSAGRSGSTGERPDGPAGLPGSVRSALADAGLRRCMKERALGWVHGRSFMHRMQRLLRRKGALFAVVAALAAGAFGPSGRAEGLSRGPVAAPATAETTPVLSAGDAAGDVAVWVNPADPAASLVFGTDKRGALESYDLSGKRVQRLVRPAGTTTDVDVRTGFSLGGRPVALVGTGGRAMSFFRLDAAARQLRQVGAHDFPTKGAGAGFCLYHSAVSGHFYAFVTEPDGDVTQYELSDKGGLVDAREVRSWPLGRRATHCVADDETGRLLVSQPQGGIWGYNAEPDASPLARQQVDKVSGGHLASSVAGLALVTQPGKRGFLLASSPGDNSFAIYRRGQNHGWLGQRQVRDGAAADGCSTTDGIEAVAANLGPRFPAGIFVCQDSRNTPPGPAGRQNFKYVRLEQLLDASSLPA